VQNLSVDDNVTYKIIKSDKDIVSDPAKEKLLAPAE
jgi:hypothetical protein